MGEKYPDAHICKGGINMQLFPEKKKRICEMFDSFCKMVIWNYTRNLKRAEANQRKYYSI